MGGMTAHNGRPCRRQTRGDGGDANSSREQAGQETGREGVGRKVRPQATHF